MSEEKTPDTRIRQLIIKMLYEPNAHLMLNEIADRFPEEHYGTVPPGFSHSAWQLLEHLRIDQEDILKFTIDPSYQSPEWPDDYWPKEPAPPSKSAWLKSIEKFGLDLKQMADLAKDEANDINKPLEHGTGQTILAEVIGLINHNSYHFGQLMMLRKYLEPNEKR